jgi:streptogrisin D
VAIVVVLLGCGVPAAASPELTVTGLLGALAGPDAAVPDTAWGVDPTTGQVQLTVFSSAPTDRVDGLLRLADRYGNKVRVRQVAGALSEQVYGGDEISDGQILCSAGFNVTRGGQDYLLTAGHCTAGLPDWQNVGPSESSNFPDTDFGLVRNDSGDAPGGVDMYDQSVRLVSSVGTAAVGEPVCASGEATGVTCGKVTAVDQTVDYGDGNVVHGLIETDVHTDHGDSGGPLFDGNTGLGTVSGGDGQTDYFQPLSVELDTYGLSLAASPW